MQLEIVTNRLGLAQLRLTDNDIEIMRSELYTNEHAHRIAHRISDATKLPTVNKWEGPEQ